MRLITSIVTIAIGLGASFLPGQETRLIPLGKIAAQSSPFTSAPSPTSTGLIDVGFSPKKPTSIYIRILIQQPGKSVEIYLAEGMRAMGPLPCGASSTCDYQAEIPRSEFSKKLLLEMIEGRAEVALAVSPSTKNWFRSSLNDEVASRNEGLLRIRSNEGGVKVEGDLQYSYYSHFCGKTVDIKFSGTKPWRPQAVTLNAGARTCHYDLSANGELRLSLSKGNTSSPYSLGHHVAGLDRLVLTDGKRPRSISLRELK